MPKKAKSRSRRGTASERAFSYSETSADGHKNQRKKVDPSRKTGVTAYYETLQRVFSLQSQILSGVLPHAGERGANDEERVRDFLTKVLPRKFSVGTGFIVCSDPSTPASSQTDVVIFDEIQNSPLHRELSAFIYPIEMIYGVLEVKATLRRGDLDKIMLDIQKVRAMAQHRRYIEYVSIVKDPTRPTQRVAGQAEKDHKGPPPRSFVFAFAADGWSDIQSLVESLTKAAQDVPAHIHGLVVLDRDWYIAQEAYAGNSPRFRATTGNALLQFVNGLTHSISSIRMHQCSIDRYMTPRA